MKNVMWGGRFTGETDLFLQEMNASIGFDVRLAQQDILGSKAHVQMLSETGILAPQDCRSILQGLDQVQSEIMAGEMAFSPALEDIHMHIEARLAELIGEAAGHLHTARSRNDQVALDFKLWIRETIDILVEHLKAVQRIFAEQALQYAQVIMPGFTHLQAAQPITFGHHLLAYTEMFERDRQRFLDARKRLNECPLGAAALAGTSFPIDRYKTAQTLGFTRPTANSLDSVSDRDFVLETLSAAAICAMHLSRIAEEIILWVTPQFNFLHLSEKFTTGSSIMPQKRNPDIAELIRGKSGRIMSAFTHLLIVMKGLPLAYAKDMQEDKEGTFDALDSLKLCLSALPPMIASLQLHPEEMKEAANLDYATATDLADWLTRTLKISFRQAHHIAGRCVAVAAEKGLPLNALPLNRMQEIEPRITEKVYEVLSVEQSVHTRTSYGGTAPENVRKQAQAWLKTLQPTFIP